MQLSKWTPILLSAIAVCGSCARPDKTVWVDLSRVPVAAEPRAVIAQAPAREFSLPPEAVGIEEIQPSKRGEDVVEQRRDEALRLMEAQFAELQTELEQHFRRVIMTDAQAEVNALRRTLSGAIRSRADAAVEEISDLIQNNAPIRGRMIVRAALIVGWPNIRGYSENELRRSRLLREWDAEGRALHELIRANEQEIDAQIAEILQRIMSLDKEEAARIEADVQAILRRADERARDLTRERLEQTRRTDLPPLLEAHEVAVQAQPARSTRIDGIQARMQPSTAPIVEGERILLLKEKLDIFLRVHGYKLGGPQSAPDMTAEFIAWLKNP